ncbi:MAG: M48 family metallopeptidase [Gemmatimonadaceae bacterium]|nr:M48 family metallopeptidase [Gemmatimonadaceae bacterium]
MPTPSESGIRRALVLAGLLAAAAARSPLAAQAPCDPVPALPEQSVASSFEPQVRQMLREQADFQKANCEVKTPRALRVARLLKPLAAAARDVGASTRFLVLNKNEENAFATGWPDNGYHLIVVYTGMIEALDRRAAQAAPRSGRTASELGDVFLSTVIAHEMSHLLLRHAQDRNCRGSDRLAAGGDAAGGGVEGTRVAAPGVIACRSYSQGKELSADSLAAYLMFATRRNSVFSDAGEMVRLWELDAAEERASGENAFWGERVLSTHPSSVRRAALYLRMWAGMLEEQDRYDSAIGLISANIEVDRGIAMLDSVRRALPGTPFVDEAMAAALLTQWLASVPVGALGVRPTVGVVRTRFVEGLRGDNTGDPALLARARTALESMRDVENRPASLSNLALLDAYTGNGARALQRARRAAQLASGDASVLNTLGVAYYQAGQADSARAVFGRILTGDGSLPTETSWRASCLSDKTKPMSTRVCFNYARALFERDRPAGLTLLAAYRDVFGQQPWGQEAGRIVMAARNGGSTTLPAGGQAPSVAPTPRPSAPSGGASSKIGNLGFRSIQLVSPDGLRRVGTGMRPREARTVVPGVAEAAGSGGTEGRVLQSAEAGVGLLVQPDPAGGERVVGIVSSGGWSLAGITPGQPVSALSRLGRPVDRDADTYVFVVTGHLVRVITDGVVIRSVVVRTDQ